MKKAQFGASAKYNAQEVEAGRYQWWVEQGLFKHQPHSSKPPFSILMPPPNITGKLHLGHAWDGYIEDALIRYKKLQGYDTLFIPGMDHAGIATQAKVEAYLRQEKHLQRSHMEREEFINQIWQWKENYTKTIRQQWAQLGLALDYDLEKFTLDNDVNHLVNYVFVHLYRQGLIYRGKRIVNWDPVQKTAISNIEVIYKEVPGSLYYFRYPLVDSKEHLEVATTRPETMFSDQALAVNPQDERYKKYIGRKVINPVNNQKIPVVADEYVDMSFGSGVMKVTPAHDFNDFEVAKRHHLKMPLCMNEDGSMNEACGINYVNLDRSQARDLIVKMATQNGSLFKVKPILHSVGFSERSDAVVEPLLSDQWFVKMEGLAKEIVRLQASRDKVNFFPKRFNEVLIQWMKNPQDWTISRQLWWGHRIPAWYHKKTQEIYVGLTPPSNASEWVQDSDVLDTWFSSSLWPLATLKWNQDHKSALFERYYPLNALVSGYDIIFFWVARMIFQSLELVGKKPFERVLVHGLIRDNQGRKMSKSLNNGIDPMEVIAEHGSDALRFALLTGSTPGQDLRFNPKRVEAAWNFFNKLWNVATYVALQLPENFVSPQESSFSPVLGEINIRIWNRLEDLIKEINRLMEKFELASAANLIYRFVWDEFAASYIEQTKVILKSENPSTPLAQETLATLVFLLKSILVILHPFAPFVTEHLYQAMELKKSILEEKWPEFVKGKAIEQEWLEDLDAIKQTITIFRHTQQISKKEPLRFIINLEKSSKKEKLVQNLRKINFFLANMLNAQLEIGLLERSDKLSLLVKDQDYFLEIIYQQAKENLSYLIQEQKRLDEEINRSRSLLTNQEFLTKARPEKVALEKEKYKKYQRQRSLITQKIKDRTKAE